MYQKITLVGNLGRDPEMRYTPNGEAVCNFSVATNRKFTRRDGSLGDETTWFRVTTWGKSAENANQYLNQGSRVLVEGRLVPDPQTGGPKIFTRNDGTAGSSYEIQASMVRYLDSKSDGNGNGNGNRQHAPAAKNANAVPEETPPW